MNREPIGLYIFRFILGFGLFAFMCLLYWSSVLVEEGMKGIRSDLTELKGVLTSIREELVDLNHVQYQAPLTEAALPKPTFGEDKHPLMDPKLPNLLEEDPFYAKTLPEMLGSNFRPRGTLRSAEIGNPDHLHPFSNWSQVATWTSLCTVTCARLQFGKYETFAPDMAIKIEKRRRSDVAAPEYWVFLRDNVFWQPLRQDFFSDNIELAPHFQAKNKVTAHDYKFFFDAFMNPHVQEAGAVALRTLFEDIEDVIVKDDLTFVVRWNVIETEEKGGIVPRIKYVAKQLTGGLRPLPSFVYQYFSDGSKIIEDDSDPDTYRINSVWAQNFTQHWARQVIVSCGPWIFDGMTERQVSFRRNPDHYFPLDALSKRLEVELKNTPDAVWQAFKVNRLDSHELRPDQLIELEMFLDSEIYEEQATNPGDQIDRLDYLARRYSYLGWNENTPFFGNKNVRRAMTLAIDRKRIISQVINGMGYQITGPFSPASPAYNQKIEPWPYDPEEAKRILEGEGWFDSDGDGIIDKEIDGVRTPFEFYLTYYVKNPTTKAVCEYVSTALRTIGVVCHLKGVDIADLSSAFDEKSFDVLYLAWVLGTPPENTRQLWHSSGAKERGSSNAIGFSNAEIDQIIERLDYEDDRETRLALYHRFHEIIHEEVPYTFMYAPNSVFLYRDRLQNVFLPVDRQDLVPGADIAEPDSRIFWTTQ